MVVIQKAVYLQCSNEAASKYKHYMTNQDIKKATLEQLRGELKSCLNLALKIQEQIESKELSLNKS